MSPLKSRVTALAAAVVGAALTTTALAPAADASERPLPTRVVTAEGPVQGAVTGAVRTFQGIPYAAPPTGERRWKKPAAVRPWSATLDARAPRSACAQPTDQPISIAGGGSEDCLYLNVTTPAGRSARPRPVIVWIHGGSFAYGDGASYGAAKLAAARQGAVVVTVDYRLGVFGFLTAPGLRAPANLGLLDQQAALRWVARNAAAFGGDPGNVTLMGQSGGGYSVCAQLVSPGARGLFHKAIVQSAGCVGPDGSFTRAQAEDQGEAVVAAALGDGTEDVDSRLRALPTADLVEASASGHDGYRPVVDGEVVPEAPAEAIAAGRFARVPVLHGSTRDEMSGLAGMDELMTGRPLTAEGYAEKVTNQFGADAPAVLAEYPVERYPAPGAALSAVLTDSEWSTAALDTQRALARHTSVYAYEFAEASAPYFRGVPRPASFSLGTGHMTDLAYLFENELFEPLDGAQEELSDTAIGYWSRFASTGRMNGPGLPAWRRFTDDGRYVQRLASGDIGRTDFAAGHHYAFWKRLASS
ncbi:carboxylesterase/lipase family protein [Streptomyces drozdowiczii]|uniref:Carboxylic ester hydrolase n=1 Tax=Streptomyces drozdowiczii TaxID=202862 RepID=A0ABY6PVG0_9ACTN|nr:carboxylesterase family protein [Streptomyces drozdowiczii]MCX0244078.1 carboxylesterase family protein [Streptomyces drozdowiczii]UZK56096.1 carboxylesterase family protein [Streptomyces drozdowiczii]